jgi:proteasome accessory factor C
MSTPDRLSRLLALVPYLLARPGIRIADAADDLSVTEKQLRDDLQLLFVCGLPGYGPGDLIDMSLDDDTVTITYDAGMDRPLRLNADEALALVVALRSLAEVPGLTTGDVVGRALAKLESAAGDAADAAGRVAVQTYADETTMRAVGGALERGHALRLTYYTAGRDATTNRVVDPMRLLLVSGRTYLEAWCRRAEAVRRFRLDRIDALTELDEPSRPPAEAHSADVRGGIFQASGDQPLVTLRVGRASRWITEYYPCEDVRAETDGRWTVSLRASDLAWARRLVMGLGRDAEVVAPAALAEEVRAEARAALAAYGPAATPAAAPAEARP